MNGWKSLHVPCACDILVTADSKGRAIAYIPLDKLPEANATSLGDTLRVSVEWIGPTRELIKEAKVIRCAMSSHGSRLCVKNRCITQLVTPPLVLCQFMHGSSLAL